MRSFATTLLLILFSVALADGHAVKHPCCLCACRITDQHVRCFVICARAMDKNAWLWPVKKEDKQSCVKLCAVHNPRRKER